MDSPEGIRVKVSKTFPPFEPKSRKDHISVDNPPHAVLRKRAGAGEEPNTGLTNTHGQISVKGLATSPRSVRRRGPLPGSPGRRQREEPIKGLNTSGEAPLLPDGRPLGRMTQKWPSKNSYGLGNQRSRKWPNSKFHNCGPILTINGKNWPNNLYK
jgi:hypothetical protein